MSKMPTTARNSIYMRMRAVVSDTAEWGDYVSGPRVITKQTRATMKKILKEIQSGKFAKQWIAENETGRKNYNALKKKGAAHKIEKVGKKLRGMMSWIK